MRYLVSIILVLAPAVFPVVAQPNHEAGRRSYDVCAGCHGFVGEGNQLVAAPRLAGIEIWYLERQMQQFVAGQRGHVDGDSNGQRMALIAQSVSGERELEDLLAWISSLPSPSHQPQMSGAADSVEAQSLYGLCAACHGTDGMGNAMLNAPALVTLDDWYLIEQLRLYAEGLRGTHPGDIYGAQMRALVASYDTDDERQMLADYIATLRSQ